MTIKSPNFFLVGAPKCGTTSISHWLGQNPECYFSPVKEPHFFAKHYDASSMLKYDQFNYDEYIALFSNAEAQHKAIGEGSTHYLRSKAALQDIHDTFPKARIIVCLRNPIEMAKSMHDHSVFWGNEHIKDFAKAWRSQVYREKSQKVGAWMKNPTALAYGQLCSLGTQLDNAIGIFGSDNVHTIFMDDIKNNATDVYEDLCDFLDIQKFEVSLHAKNVSRGRRSHLFNITYRALKARGALPSRVNKKWFKLNETYNVCSLKKSPIPDALRLEMVEYFRPEVEKIEKLCRRDLSHWKKV